MTQTRNKSLPFDNTRFWIFFLSLLLVVLNFIVFHIYQQSHLGENLWTQLWSYFQSDAFKVITTSIILPIILFLLERLFKIREAIGERIERERQRRRDARWKCIEETSKMWNEYYNLISEVKYLQIDANKEANVRDKLRRLQNFDSSVNAIVNKWLFRFPNLSDKDTNHLFEHNMIYFLSMLGCSTITIAYSIQKSDSQAEIDELQSTLGVIQDKVKSIVQHTMLTILKDSITVLEDADLAKRAAARERIKCWLEELNHWGERLRQEERRYNDMFSTIKGDQGKALREGFKKAESRVEEWRRTHPDKPLSEFKEFSDFMHLFHQIKHEDIIHAEEFYYSLEWVRHLADLLAFEFKAQLMLERATWPK